MCIVIDMQKETNKQFELAERFKGRSKKVKYLYC